MITSISCGSLTLALVTMVQNTDNNSKFCNSRPKLQVYRKQKVVEGGPQPTLAAPGEVLIPIELKINNKIGMYLRVFDVRRNH